MISLHLCLVWTSLIIFMTCGTNSVGNIVSNYRFHPMKNMSCYDIYNSAERVDPYTYMKPRTRRRRSCVTKIPEDPWHCTITTPSEENIIVPCFISTAPKGTHSPDNDFSYDSSVVSQCFKVIKNGKHYSTICLKYIDDDSSIFGLTTPDNYTVLIGSKHCIRSEMSVDIAADTMFASSFIFDPKEQNCFNIYKPGRDISPYSCWKPDYTSCVRTWKGHNDDNKTCGAITTQNNETLIIYCNGRTKLNENCLEVYHNGTRQEVCLETLEDGCVGVTTPSRLKVLFGCRICLHRDKKELIRRRQYLDAYFENELQGSNCYYHHEFVVIGNHTNQTFRPSWLPKIHCYGFVLDSNETVVVYCKYKQFKPGCLKLISSDLASEIDICARVYQQNCIIIETPKQKVIVLDCFDNRILQRETGLGSLMEQYKPGKSKHYKYELRRIYQREGRCVKCYESFVIEWLEDHKCWGTVTDDEETVLLECPNRNSTGCLKVYSWNQEEQHVCVKVISDYCVGIETPSGWKFELNCLTTKPEYGFTYALNVNMRRYNFYKPTCELQPEIRLVTAKPKEPSDVF